MTVTAGPDHTTGDGTATRAVVDAYYRLANAGDWDAWCDLFTEDMVMDEQLAGHLETLDVLRPMMAGMGEAYSHFQNVPRHVVVEGDTAAVLSHISARVPTSDQPIEAEVMNYFQLRDGRIAYMTNVHDSVPFKPFLDQLAARSAAPSEA